MRPILTLLFAAFTLTIAACSTVNPAFERSVNLKALNHRATDALIASAGTQVSSDIPVVVASISNTSELETSSPLGRTISEQVMTRLIENGFTNVSEIRLRRSLYLRERSENVSGEFLLSRDARAIAESRQAGAAVTGTYAVANKQVLVSLRMIEVATGKILGSHDYVIPTNSNIEELLGEAETGNGNMFSNTTIYTGF